MSKAYSNRGNCARAARVALGKDAKIGTDFSVTGSGKEFHWTSLAGGNGGAAAAITAKPAKPARVKKAAAPKKAKRVKGDAKLQDQPQMKKIIKACQRVNGASIIELAEILGGVEQHTVRGAISKLKSEAHIAITTSRPDGGRTKRFHVEAGA